MARSLLREDINREREAVLSHLNGEDSSALGSAIWRARLDALDGQLAELGDELAPQASVALMFEGDPVLGTTEIRADFAAKMLDSFQNLVGVMYAQSAGRHLNGQGRAPLLDQSRLYLREMARGSVGFVLEEKEPAQTDFVDSPLKAVVEDAVGMIEAISLPAVAGEDPLAGLSPRVVQSAHKFAKALSTSHATARILSDTKTVLLPEERVLALYLRLDEARVTEQLEKLPGIILGLLPESGKFEFKAAVTDEIILGDTSTDIQFRYISDAHFHDRFVMRPVLATIRSLQIIRAGRPGKRDFVLEDVEARSEDDGLQRALASE